MAPSYPTAWVARRLGVSAATLRTWHFRYGLAPSAWTAGGHRRYSGADVGRLDVMRQLIRNGVPAAEAARLSHGDRPAAWRRTPTVAGERRAGEAAAVPPRVRQRLHRAAIELDGAEVDAVLADMLRVHGVVPAWVQVVLPVLQQLGARFAEVGDCIPAEHLLTERVHATFSAVVGRRRSFFGSPVMLAAAEYEQHVLPLHALAAALAERRCPSVVLGALPVATLAEAIGTVKPAAVFLWAHLPVGRRAALATLDRRGPDFPGLVIGGPGWPTCPSTPPVPQVADLATAVERLLPADRARPMSTRPASRSPTG